MRGAGGRHGSAMRLSRRIGAGGIAVATASVVFILAGVVCLLIAGLAMHKFMPREGKVTPPWTRTELGDSTVALGTFVLLIAGLALVIKGLIA
jgi:hypothetical protein